MLATIQDTRFSLPCYSWTLLDLDTAEVVYNAIHHQGQCEDIGIATF